MRFIEEDRCVDVAQLASVFEVSTQSIFNIFMMTLALSRSLPAGSQAPQFHWDNASVHTAAVVTKCLAAKAFKVIMHPTYSPDLAPADFFLFPKVKNALPGVHLDDGELKNAWDGVTATIAAADWMAAFNAWVRCCNKCIDVAGNFVKK